MKSCKTCGETKPTDQFSKDRRRRDGLQGECRVCASARASAWQKQNRERAYETHAAFRQRHPDRKAAQNAVYKAVRDGRLTKTPCEVCGSPDVEAHHGSYEPDQRLNVRWLCRPHHGEADVERRMAA